LTSPCCDFADWDGDDLPVFDSREYFASTTGAAAAQTAKRLRLFRDYDPTNVVSRNAKKAFMKKIR
jgi:hypothetical protein